ncbi:MAG TPA: CoA-acylating methylmalonate-semialdehyde dehydrogenase [Solirubrobacteraceae bacterium]|nr:CoA-acylating methylmalonate-semialdehyde dehydrogenase [Solirubrobacteraceae bacterium]
MGATETAADTLRNYIGGRWVDARPEGALEDRDPASGELLAHVPLSGASDVDAAARAARAAQPSWRAVPVQARARALLALREALIAHRGELARLVARDMGKTLADADAEVGRGIESVESAAAVPHLMKGENLEGVARGVDVELVRQPVGVVAAITPFNFPAMIPLWFLPYAIATGNTFILKPSEQDPLTSQRIVQLIDAIDEIPEGVVNLVHGGREAVTALLEHPAVNAISFVGSAATARLIASRAAQAGKRVQALGGAKNAMIIMPDADPDVMVAGVMGSSFGAAGQRCLAGSVAVLVGTREEQDATLERIVARARELRVGPGLEPGTDVCPLVSPASRERLEDEIEAAVAAGARVVLDGRTDPGPGGTLLGPTILEHLPEESHWLREELFGPVLCVRRVADLDAAIAWCNGSRYGNSAVLFTTSGSAARAFRYGIEAGMLGVNIGVAAPVAWFPFAGFKDSFDGDLHANGHDAFEFYTRKKVVTSRW